MLIQELTIAAEEVQKDDYLFYKYFKGIQRRLNWVRVVNVEKRNDGQICITTVYWETVKHPKEGVEVQRIKT